jgi:hypothetical protein
MDLLMDYFSNLNWVAVGLAAAASYAVSAVWYSQGVFGKQWMKAAGITKKTGKGVKKSDRMTVIMVTSAITVFITAVALAILVDALALKGFTDGAVLGTLVAGGFLVTNNGMHKLFEERPWMHFGITAVGDVVSLAVMGGVLGLLK